MIRMLLLVLLFVGLFRFITRIVFPLLRITSAVHGQMRNMQQNTAQEPAPARPERNARKGEYIDFEEEVVK